MAQKEWVSVKKEPVPHTEEKPRLLMAIESMGLNDDEPQMIIAEHTDEGWQTPDGFYWRPVMWWRGELPKPPKEKGYE